MTSRRKFLADTSLVMGALMCSPLLRSAQTGKAALNISLAEWSLHRSIRAGKMDHLDFASKARSFGIGAIEYVNGLFGTKTMDFREAGKSNTYLQKMLTRSKDEGVANHLIMVD